MGHVTQGPTTCPNCGVEIDEAPSTPVDQRQPCPSCGSTRRFLRIKVSETVGVKEQLRGRKRPGDGGPWTSEVVSGDDLHRATGKWNKKVRVIDRENNYYFEEIMDPETGAVIKRQEHPLDKHTGHGAAKYKRKGTKP